MLVGNIDPQTFGLDDNALLLVDAHGHVELPRASKQDLARQLDAGSAVVYWFNGVWPACRQIFWR